MQMVRRFVFSAFNLAWFFILGAALCWSAEGTMPDAPALDDKDKLIVDKFKAGLFPLVHDKRAADVFVDSSDWKVARIGARDLTLDIQRVSGCKALLKTRPKSFRRTRF